MPYSIRRQFLFFWFWRASAGGEQVSGFALTKAGAKRAAKAWSPKPLNGAGRG